MNGRSGPALVVGLGNPGPKYAGNRHNVGQMVLDLLAERCGARLKSLKGMAAVASGLVDGHKLILAIPASYMNDSGRPVAGVASYFKVEPTSLIVVHDELDIPFGQLRLKRGGGEGGHNGLRSISTSLGSADYVRVRVGIGRPPGRMDPADFVLQDFTKAERRELPELLDRAADAAMTVVTDGLEIAQNRFNGG